MDWRVLALSAGLCLVSTVLFGLVPALQASKIDLAAAMKSESGGVVGGRGKAWIRSSLVLVQVSLSFMLLVGAALLVKSLNTMRDTDLGFTTNNVMFTSVDMVAAGYDAQRIRNFQDQLLTRVQQLPGVDQVTLSRSVPFSLRGYSSAPIAVDGFVVETGEQMIRAIRN